MANYYTLNLKLSKKQMGEFMNDLSTRYPHKLTLKPIQIDVENGDMFLVTKVQLNKLLLAKRLKKNITLTFSRAQMIKMFNGMMDGSGFLDSIGKFFKSGYNKVTNFFNKKPVEIEMRNMASIKPKINPMKDYGIENDYKPVGWKPPKKSTFDTIAEKVTNFDKNLSKTFSYNPNMNVWKNQKYGYKGDENF